VRCAIIDGEDGRLLQSALTTSSRSVGASAAPTARLVVSALWRSILTGDLANFEIVGFWMFECDSIGPLDHTTAVRWHLVYQTRHGVQLHCEGML